MKELLEKEMKEKGEEKGKDKFYNGRLGLSSKIIRVICFNFAIISNDLIIYSANFLFWSDGKIVITTPDCHTV